MSSVEHDRRIDYIEFSVKSVPEAKRFYGSATSSRRVAPSFGQFSAFPVVAGFTLPIRAETSWQSGRIRRKAWMVTGKQ
jgi:hypothetical protein